MPFGGRPVCPLPKKGKKGVSNGRTVGSVNVVTCPQRWTGGGNAKCMKDLTWDKDIDECVEIHNHSCKNDTLCSEIGAECIDGKCSCLSGYIYSNKTFMCYEESACGEPPPVAGAMWSGNGEVRQYTCDKNKYPLPGKGNGTITCDSGTSSWVPKDFQCGGA
ncbi:uncharacterized protein LOC123561933 [Mercenaria mercenaria]|uniref:uncharacterized protein LOC123561933 n=1 Tax=Mercenaria mercenaria TaxID=6596 RepID=UPI00234F157F|nr:uncharacterized protein LOC123561933 [Mercenaria mercenaria]